MKEIKFRYRITSYGNVSFVDDKVKVKDPSKIITKIITLRELEDALAGRSDSSIFIEKRWGDDINHYYILSRDQYAGITDRNGDDVYENDRIKEHPNGHIGIIKKDMGNFYVEWDDPNYPDWSWNEMVYDHTDRIEVIDTIYNNEKQKS